VDQLRGAAAGSGREVRALDQRDREATRDEVERYAGAGDPAADYRDVELLARQAREMAFALP
jgi:hypothetical protein